MHIDTYLNELFSFESRSNNSKRSLKWLLKIPKCTRKIERDYEVPNYLKFYQKQCVTIKLLLFICQSGARDPRQLHFIE